MASGRAGPRVTRVGEFAISLTSYDTWGAGPVPYLGRWGRPVPTCKCCWWAGPGLWEWESSWADQLSYISGPDPGLWIDPPQHLLMNFWSAWRGSFHKSKITGSPWHCTATIEESHWGSSIDSVAEARGLELDNDSLQWTFASKGVWTDVYTVRHTGILQLLQWGVFFFLLVGEVARVESRHKGRGDRSGIWIAWCEIHKEPIKSFFKKVVSSKILSFF